METVIFPGGRTLSRTTRAKRPLDKAIRTLIAELHIARHVRGEQKQDNGEPVFGSKKEFIAHLQKEKEVRDAMPETYLMIANGMTTGIKQPDSNSMVQREFQSQWPYVELVYDKYITLDNISFLETLSDTERRNMFNDIARAIVTLYEAGIVHGNVTDSAIVFCPRSGLFRLGGLDRANLVVQSPADLVIDSRVAPPEPLSSMTPEFALDTIDSWGLAITFITLRPRNCSHEENEKWRSTVNNFLSEYYDGLSQGQLSEDELNRYYRDWELLARFHLCPAAGLLDLNPKCRKGASWLRQEIANGTKLWANMKRIDLPDAHNTFSEALALRLPVTPPINPVEAVVQYLVDRWSAIRTSPIKTMDYPEETYECGP